MKNDQFSDRLRDKLRVNFDGDYLDSLILEAFERLREQLRDLRVLESLGIGFDYANKLVQQLRILTARSPTEDIEKAQKSTYEKLRKAHVKDPIKGLDVELKHSFYGLVAGSRITESDIANQIKLADLRYPVEWFPRTRAKQRTIHLHVGPTNSGKTYHALRRLEEAETGVYAGPLRLLAHEVYSRLNANGKPCNLITGDEQRIAEGGEATMYSCTVEMVPINSEVEVAVIDEIQMIASPERGWAWTQALLGVQATEVHLCGEERTVPLIRDLAASMGEKLEVHHYKRLSPLKTMTSSLRNNLKNLRKGDCVVAFSRKEIHSLKSEIQKVTGKQVAVVYGSLPPETRAQQARLFNDPNNDFDVLVASDAIGMGLNLSIKRIIFQNTWKYNGRQFKQIAISDIKQIAGRAGRYRTAEEGARSENGLRTDPNVDDSTDSVVDPIPPAKNLGLVTALNDNDLLIVQEAMESEAQPIQSAGIFPPSHIVQRFASYFPKKTPFSYLLRRLHELSQMHPRFHLCLIEEQVAMADILQPVEQLTIADKMIFCMSPARCRDPETTPIVQAFARCVVGNGSGALLDIPEMNLELLDQETTADNEYLSKLESLHQSLILYLWLSYRFRGVFVSRPLAFHVKRMAEEKIHEVLSKFRISEKAKRAKMNHLREQSMILGLKKRLAAEDAEGESDIALPLDWDDNDKKIQSMDGEVFPETARTASS
ncbi:MAG: RNA helicase [Pycnora praestabilis]|nr:MAG: RNA helicase [Pycnora praestabilis]